MRESQARSQVSIGEARQAILGQIRPLGPETVDLRGAVGRVLLEELRAERDIPPADNSAMDGFALRAEDVAQLPASLRVVEDLPAGRRSERKLGPGEAARIMTGAALPAGADSVVMLEHTESTPTRVTVPLPMRQYGSLWSFHPHE